MANQVTVKRRSPLLPFMYLGLLYLLARWCCAPPAIPERPPENIEEITIDEFYEDVRSYVKVAMMVEGEVTSSFFLAGLGGFFFIRSLESDKTMLCFMNDMPPEEGSKIIVYGEARPILVKGSTKLTYIKYKDHFSISRLAVR